MFNIHIVSKCLKCSVNNPCCSLVIRMTKQTCDVYSPKCLLMLLKQRQIWGKYPVERNHS